MKSLVMTFVALISTQALALGIPAGRGGCGSETNNVYSVQFGWTANGTRLTDVVLTESMEPVSHADADIVSFDLRNSKVEFVKGVARTRLNVDDGKGNRVQLDIVTDKDGIGRGTISWEIGSRNFQQKNQPAICSMPRVSAR